MKKMYMKRKVVKELRRCEYCGLEEEVTGRKCEFCGNTFEEKRDRYGGMIDDALQELRKQE